MAMGSIDSLSTRSLRSLVNLLISPNDFLMIYNPDFNGYARTPMHLNSFEALEPEGTRHSSSQSHPQTGSGTLLSARRTGLRSVTDASEIKADNNLT